MTHFDDQSAGVDSTKPPALAGPPMQPKRPQRVGLSTWIVGAMVLLALIAATAGGGIGAGLLTLGLAAASTGFFVMVTGRRSWARLPDRNFGAAAMGGSLVLMLAASVIGPATHQSSAQVNTPPATATATPAPTASAVPAKKPAAKTAAPTPTAKKTAPAAKPAPASKPTATPAAKKPVTYKDCAAVWAALGGPIKAGQPGYDKGMDIDGNGVACESKP